jgi:hypothetical protein
VAVPAAGQLTAGRDHGRSTGTFTRRDGTGDTGTGFCFGTGRSVAGPDSPDAPPDGGVIAVSSGTAASTPPATTSRR